jgi:hypothetical protein
MNAIAAIVTIAYYGNAYLTKRREQTAEAIRQKEAAAFTRRKEEAELNLRREELATQRLKDQADATFRTLEAEISLERFLAELEVSHFIVTRDDDHVELRLAGGRDDIEVDVARGEHVLRVGSSRCQARDVCTSQAGLKAYTESVNAFRGCDPSDYQ